MSSNNGNFTYAEYSKTIYADYRLGNLNNGIISIHTYHDDVHNFTSDDLRELADFIDEITNQTINHERN